MTIEQTLQERGNRYGEYTQQACISQRIKRAIRNSPNWAELPDFQKEALDMIANKLGRILNGDPYYHDNWYDIVGYAKLVADALENKQTTGS